MIDVTFHVLVYNVDMKKLILTFYKTLFPFAIVGAIAVQVAHFSNHDTTFTVGNYFSQFTIISNTFAVVALLLSLYYLSEKAPKWVNTIRVLAAVNLIVTGIVYQLFLSGGDPAIPWTNTVVHIIAPILIFVDWLLDYPKRRITFKQSLIVPVFLGVYALYTAVRGQIVDWYPYSFVDISELGVLKVAGASLGIVVAGTIAALLLTQIPNKLFRRTD